MSKIAFFCIPAQGHTNPTLAVVKELVKRGNQVRYYSYDSLKKKIIATGAEYFSCNSFDIQMTLNPEDGERIGKDIGFSTQVMVQTTLAMDDEIIEEMRNWQPDCIVADSMAIWGKLAALKLGVPLMSSTTTFAFNRYSARVMKQSFSEMMFMLTAIPKANRQIKKLRDKGYPVKDVLSVIQNDNDTNTIVYTSPQFQPSFETFSDKYTFVGPSIREEITDVVKPEKKTIYISMGTVNNNRKTFFQNCIEAFRKEDVNVIMSIGDFLNPEDLGDIPDNFTVVHRVNQMEVLQKVDAFLTHCGMNSVNEALYYRVPLVMFPQTQEQGGVAYRVNELGAGMFLKDESASGIRAAMKEVMENSSYRENASKIADGFHQCGGYMLAADKIEALAQKG